VAFIGLEVVFPAVFAVFGMGEDFQDEDAAGVVMDGCDVRVLLGIGEEAALGDDSDSENLLSN
jgi:hypothetical protein